MCKNCNHNHCKGCSTRGSENRASQSNSDIRVQIAKLRFSVSEFLANSTQEFAILWSDSDPKPGDPSEAPESWGEVGTDNSVWMAITKKVNGAWAVWSVVRLKGAKGEPGDPGGSTGPQGEPGPEGPPGRDGADLSINGFYRFEVIDGDLIVIYNSDNSAPDFEIVDGDLILTID